MDKTQFIVVLQNAGYICDMKDGIPTVHTNNKKIIKDVRNIAKEYGYNSSFGIIFDGAVALPNDNAANTDTGTSLSIDAGVGPFIRTNKTDTILPVTDSENVEANEESFDNTGAEPSLFDLFADFD